jgi:hypothetical protein
MLRNFGGAALVLQLTLDQAEEYSDARRAQQDTEER